jgi:hypothetical protein
MVEVQLHHAGIRLIFQAIDLTAPASIEGTEASNGGTMPGAKLHPASAANTTAPKTTLANPGMSMYSSRGMARNGLTQARTSLR